jgi:hypothetical protein
MNQDAGANPGAGPTTKGQPTQWEYYRLSVDGPNVETALHELGQNGWELVAVIPETRIFYGFQCFLKRPVAADRGAQSAEGPGEAKRLEGYVGVRSSSLGRGSREPDSAESIASMTWQR